MGRCTGPVEKLERREGVSLDLKGKRQLRGKAAPIAPLAHEAAEDIGLLPAWLQVDHEALSGRVLRAPQRGRRSRCRSPSSW